jgi:hypothetical protein
VFSVDVLICNKCLGPMTVIAYLTDPVVVEKILVHLGLPTTPPQLSPARLSLQVEMFEDDVTQVEPAPPRRGGRGPPVGQGDRGSLDTDGDETNTCDWGA